MRTKTILGLLVFAIGISVTSVYALPDHVTLPQQAIDNGKAFQPTIIQTSEMVATFLPVSTTVDDPFVNGYLGDAGNAKLIIQRTDFTVGCSGVLIDSTHILTAGHCITDNFGTENVIAGIATFNTITDSFTYNFAGVSAHNKWNGDLLKGNDLGVITLTEPVDSTVTIHNLDRNASNDIGQSVDIIGYGIGGYLASGSNSTLYPFGFERYGTNTIDSEADLMYQALGLKPNRDYTRGVTYQMDNDLGNSYDAFGFFFGIVGGGDNEEVGICSGDSGGGLYNSLGEVTAINSYIVSLVKANGQTTDITPDSTDCSAGEFTGATSVAKYVDWIDSQLGTSVDNGPNCNGKSKNPACL